MKKDARLSASLMKWKREKKKTYNDGGYWPI